jgi:hypothetical protein
LEIPSYELDSSAMIADHFVAKSAGQDAVARAILDGTVQTQDPRLLDYYRSRAVKQLDELSLVALENLAVAILEETNRATPLVGGPHQIGVFAKDGKIKWTLPSLATDRQKLHSTVLKIGIPYTPDSLTPQEYRAARGKKFVTNVNLSLYQPFEEPLIQVFIGSWFRAVTVSLDGNVFAGNHFRHVRFKYKGGPFEWFDNNTLSDCVVETPTEVELPVQLVSCKQEQQTSLDDAGAFGAPVRTQPTGCVKWNAEGKLVLKTDGWDNGKNGYPLKAGHLMTSMT